MEAAFTKRALIFGSISAFFVTNYTAFLYLRKNNPIFVRETFWPAFLNSSYHFLLCFVVSKLLIPDPIQETRPFTQLIPQGCRCKPLTPQLRHFRFLNLMQWF